MDLTALPEVYQDSLSSMARAKDKEAARGPDPKEKYPEYVLEEPTPRQTYAYERFIVCFAEQFSPKTSQLQDPKRKFCVLSKNPLNDPYLLNSLKKIVDQGFGWFCCFWGILKKGFSLDAVTFTCLIKGLCVEKRIMVSRELFKKMVAVDCRPDVITYITLIHGLCCVGDWEEGKRLFILMMDQGVRPFVVTFGVVIHECCKKGNLDETNRFMELMIQRGVDPDIYTYGILMNGYCLVDRIGDARGLFDSITRKGYKPNVVCYNTLINWYCKNKEVNKALSLYREMISEELGLM
ncbi:pentatricopeptide repeat-containing protein At1g63400-like [Pistacia vera]|uniref:pentatricopeptide repeat-containing protein At1g63400-like n=1 Tax=Pistacia vera TaxID=55513 RepID=UPI0012633641|nr:pentatricopeptide repeat-containing protein At1g63400-like [Pistacia vera]